MKFSYPKAAVLFFLALASALSASAADALADEARGALARHARASEPAVPAPTSSSVASSVRQAIDLLDAQDRWIVTQRGARVISTSAYIANVNLLCAYLEAEPGSR